SNRILVEENALLDHLELYVSVDGTSMYAGVAGLHHGRSNMVDIRISLCGNNLNCLDIAVLGETRINRNVRPPIGSSGLHDQVFRQSYDDIRLANLPRQLIRELARWRHVGGISLRSAAVHPLNDRGDFLVSHRRIVIEVLHAHVLIDEPGWHLPSNDFRLDGLGSRAHVFVSQQRHRSNGAGAMTNLAMLLQDRRHVPGEGDLILRNHCGRDHCESGNDHQQAEGSLHCESLLVSLLRLSKFLTVRQLRSSRLCGPAQGSAPSREGRIRRRSHLRNKDREWRCRQYPCLVHWRLYEARFDCLELTTWP